MQKDELKELRKRSKLPLALGTAIGMAVIMTLVSIVIYYLGGFNKLDLSRPGYEVEREDVSSSDAAPTYDTTSPLSADSLNKILDDFDTRARSVESYGDFNSNNLSDENVLTGQWA